MDPLGAVVKTWRPKGLQGLQGTPGTPRDSRDSKGLQGLQGAPGERRFYIRLARLPLDRSFVLNLNSIFTLY